MFVCTNEHDYNILSNELNDVNKFRVNIAQLPVDETANLSHYQPRLARERVSFFLLHITWLSPIDVSSFIAVHEQLPSVGFDNYLIDLISGPDPVLAFLCLTCNLHQIVSLIDNELLPLEIIFFLSKF